MVVVIQKNCYLERQFNDVKLKSLKWYHHFLSHRLSEQEK